MERYLLVVCIIICLLIVLVLVFRNIIANYRRMCLALGKRGKWCFLEILYRVGKAVDSDDVIGIYVW